MINTENDSDRRCVAASTFALAITRPRLLRTGYQMQPQGIAPVFREKGSCLISLDVASILTAYSSANVRNLSHGHKWKWSCIVFNTLSAVPCMVALAVASLNAWVNLDPISIASTCQFAF